MDDEFKKFFSNFSDVSLINLKCLYFSNIMTNKVIIYLTRHGESEYNVLKKIGGNSNLTDKGLHYSKVLYEYFQNDKIDVYTSNLNRTIQTSQYFHETRAYPELNEINSGICDSKTYEEIKSLYPEEYEKRKISKYCYRYPKGESYEDIKNRLSSKKHHFLDAIVPPFWLHLASNFAPFWDHFSLQCLGIFTMRFFLKFAAFPIPQILNFGALA